MTFGIGTFSSAGDVFPGLVVGDVVHDLRPALGEGVDVASLLEDWDTALQRLVRIADDPGPGVPLDQVRALPPVRPAGQVLCAGANYFRHVQQIVFSMHRNAGDKRSDDELLAFSAEQVRRRTADQPFLFLGATSALCGATDDVILWGPGQEHDWELELAVVIGRGGHRVSVDDAPGLIAGYTICNDISVRDVMNRPDLPMTDFVMTKNRPTFFPLGPYIVPSCFVPRPRELRITLRVNGEVMQDESVSDMIHGIPELVSFASHAVSLSPGDIILTGSPAGNAGHHGNRWLRSGDVIEGSITGLGSQRNVCVPEPA